MPKKPKQYAVMDNEDSNNGGLNVRQRGGENPQSGSSAAAAATATSSSSSSPTSAANNNPVVLYDVESMIHMTTNVASGYITLLSGGHVKAETYKEQALPAPQTKQEEYETILLAFAALTDGNVIDACFGITRSSSKTSPNIQIIANTKNTLCYASGKSDTIRKKAVKAYRIALQMIVEQNKQLNKLNVITKCFKSNAIYNHTKIELQQAFGPLERAIQDCLN